MDNASFGKEVASETNSASTFSSKVEVSRQKPFQRFVDSFKPAFTSDIDTTGMTEEEIHHARMAAAPMSPALKPIQMFAIAVGGSIGSGLFLGSGNDLQSGGPGGVIVGFFITGVLLFFMMQSLGEVAVRFPVQGSFSIHTMRLCDESWGFAMSWNYILQWLVCFPLELTAAAIILGYWKSDDNPATNVNPAAWVSLFWFALSLVSFAGANTWGMVETVLAVIKVVTVIGVSIFGIICAAGGGPTHHYFGTHYWHDPGSFINGAKGTVNVFVNSAFAMSGIEMVALASAEAKNPHKVLPTAVKQTFWRILLFYLVSLTICFCLVPATDPRLGTSEDGKASPFVLAIVNAGVTGLPSVVNVVILLAALSVGNAAVYASSRTLAAVANAGGAPKFIGYIDRQGRPLVGIIITVVFGLIGFVVASPAYHPAFTWMQAISGQSSLFTWGSISLNHMMLRIAMKKQGRSLKEQFYSSPYGIIGSTISFLIVMAILGLEVWVAIWPVSDPDGTPVKPSAEGFFEVWLSLPIVLAFFIGHKLWYRKPWVWPSKVDLVTGARIKTQEEMSQKDEDELALMQKPKWKRILIRTYHAWC